MVTPARSSAAEVETRLRAAPSLLDVAGFAVEWSASTSGAWPGTGLELHVPEIACLLMKIRFGIGHDGCQLSVPTECVR
jgi:hypothetical protein